MCLEQISDDKALMLINPNGSKKSKCVSGQIMKREMTELYPVIRCSLCFWQNYLSCMNKKLSFLPSSCGRTLSLYPTVILWRCFSGRWGQGQERKENKL